MEVITHHTSVQDIGVDQNLVWHNNRKEIYDKFKSTGRSNCNASLIGNCTISSYYLSNTIVGMEVA